MSEFAKMEMVFLAVGRLPKQIGPLTFSRSGDLPFCLQQFKAPGGNVYLSWQKLANLHLKGTLLIGQALLEKVLRPVDSERSCLFVSSEQLTPELLASFHAAAEKQKLPLKAYQLWLLVPALKEGWRERFAYPLNKMKETDLAALLAALPADLAAQLEKAKGETIILNPYFEKDRFLPTLG